MEIIKGLEIFQREQLMPFLFERLQNQNWPVFEQAIIELKKTDHKKVINYIELYLKKAYSEKDYMWMDGIKYLVENMNIKQSDFIDGASLL